MIATGQTPRAVVADKGFSIDSVFQHNTERGIASVIPYRKRAGEEFRPDTLAFDSDGVPRCKGCHGETRFVRFNHRNPEPRIWVRCTTPTTAACQKEQSIYCKESWRHLLPLWRNTEAYWALRESHDSYERVHHHWRERYGVAGDNAATRPRRRGRACQQLRANAALIIEWLRILWREGWLGSARRNSGKPKSGDGSEGLAKRLERRLNSMLHLPYTPEKLTALGGKFTGKPPPEPEPPPAAPPPDPADGEPAS
jgi:hypothetical protein